MMGSNDALLALAPGPSSAPIVERKCPPTINHSTTSGSARAKFDAFVGIDRIVEFEGGKLERMVSAGDPRFRLELLAVFHVDFGVEGQGIAASNAAGPCMRDNPDQDSSIALIAPGGSRSGAARLELIRRA